MGKIYSIVRFLKPVTVQYSIDASEPMDVQLTPNWAIGNFEGHFLGVEVSEQRDGNLRLTLRAEFNEMWENVPKDAVQLGSEMARDF